MQPDYETIADAVQGAVNAIPPRFRKSSGLVEALGGKISDVAITPGYWEGISNPSVQLEVLGLDESQRDMLSALIGDALYQDAVAGHGELRQSSREDANIFEVDLAGELTPQEMESLNASLKEYFGQESDGVALVAVAGALRVLNVGGVDNKHIIAWLEGESGTDSPVETLLGSKLGLHALSYKGRLDYLEATQYGKAITNQRTHPRRGGALQEHVTDFYAKARSSTRAVQNAQGTRGSGSGQEAGTTARKRFEDLVARLTLQCQRAGTH